MMAKAKKKEVPAEEILCVICAKDTGLLPDQMDEADPVCSEKCHDEFKARLKKGEFQHLQNQSI